MLRVQRCRGRRIPRRDEPQGRRPPLDGKPIRGTCYKCGKKVDLVPLPVNDPEHKQALLYYQMQRTLDEHVKRGEKLPSNSTILPVDRLLDRERKMREMNGGQQA